MPPLASLVPALTLVAASAGDDPVSFGQEVRPLLADRCFPCHGPDAATREADLRLDLRASAVADRDGSRAIDTRAPADSELLIRVRDDLDPMPPAPDHAPLSGEEAALLERWISEGAPYDEHWAYRAPERPEVPPIDPRSPEGAWVQGDIDRWVLDGLAQSVLHQ